MIDLRTAWVGGFCLLALPTFCLAGDTSFDPTADAIKRISTMKVRPTDWPQWGGTSVRNNTPEGKNIPQKWNLETGENVKWTAGLGSQSYGNPVIANGKVFVGTNNGMGYVKRYPSNVDLGCFLCFDEKTGKFLWQHSSEKLPTGRVHDWPQQGICCAPFVEGDKAWFVSSRGLVICCDTEGFHDGENDGPFKKETNENKDEADVVWQLDMMGELNISQHNMCSCSVTCLGDLLFVHTSNGVDESHINIPSPTAPSFLCLDRNTGKVIWTDNSPGTNILHGQWSSPTVAELGGVKQVLFAGGDGWLYSFKAEATPKAELLWKFDCNPKDSLYVLGSKADRNHLIGTPVVYDGKVFLAVGEDPEHGEGVGHLWCIDPTKRGDVSTQLVVNKKNPDKPISHKRLQACVAEEGDSVIPNPNSAAIWHFGGPMQRPAPGKKPPAEAPENVMHRTCGSVAIKDDILYIVDFSGFVHCLDAKTGKQHWGYDMLAASWGSPLIVENRVYVGDEDGDVTIFEHSKEMNMLYETNMGNSVYTTPVVAGNILYIADRTHVYALETGAKNASKPEAPNADSGAE
ncbi:PQQ-binding-like beta-propeller repeat protein [bacterium]|jgi:outer membrane protein assembly factor BamB|nr:PQQ-binding-like beta-propeller repeat protein [bacterium]